jgi:choline dehydrogenase
MEHVQVSVAYACNEPISLVGKDSPEQVAKYEQAKMGLLTSNLGEAGGFVRLSSESCAPELQFHFGPDWFVRHGFEVPEGHGFTILPGLVGTKSVGELKLRSADAFEDPLIDPACLAEEEDVRVMLEGVKLARKIAQASAFDRYRGAEYVPGEDVQDDDGLVEFIRNYSTSIYHPVGTCKMGNDDMAVVNNRLQVHGIEGLRVADASIMPFIVNANTNAPCMMIGEKVADMILEDNIER